MKNLREAAITELTYTRLSLSHILRRGLATHHIEQVVGAQDAIRYVDPGPIATV